MVDWKRVAAIVLGAGLSGTASGLVKKVAPDLTDEVAGAIAGGILLWKGGEWHEYLPALGAGILAGSLKTVIEERIGEVIPGVAARVPVGVRARAEAVEAPAFSGIAQLAQAEARKITKF